MTGEGKAFTDKLIDAHILKPEMEGHTEYRVLRYLTFLGASTWNLNSTFRDEKTAMDWARDLRQDRPDIPVKVQEWKSEKIRELDI